MHLIESGDAEVIVFGEMSKIFFHHYQWGVFFMKSILNKSYHHSRALWSSFVTCGCGCVFNFLSIKSKYTPLFFPPLWNPNKRSQHEQTGEEYSFISASRFFLFSMLMLMMWFNRQKCACMPSIKHTHEFVSWGEKKRKEKKSSLPSCLVPSWMEKTNKHQTSATQHKLYFIIKWLLIHASCSYGCFDQSKIVTKTHLFPFLLSSCWSP